MYQTNPPPPSAKTLPTMYDLPSEELKNHNVPEEFIPKSPLETMPTMYDLPSELVGESGLPDEFHRIQADGLSETCQPPNWEPDQVFTASDLNLYYDPRHLGWYKRPDWFLVLGVSRYQEQQDLRLSYLVWQEGVNPFLVVELLSPGTEEEDLGQTTRRVNQPPTKWEVYEQILRIPYYVIYDRYENQLRAFRLNGTGYEAISLPDGRFWLAEIQLGLGLWQGSYQGTTGLWLRWYNETGWIPTLAESAQEEHQRAEEECLRAEEEHQRAEEEHQRAQEMEMALAEERQRVQQLLAQLRSLGVSPDD
jgi:Uma2 family endonuclease